MTSSGYIPGTVDTQSRCWRDRRELHRELPHRCSLSIGERERGEKKKNYPRRAKGSSRRGCGWRSRVTRKPCYCGKFPSKGVSLINANSLTARTKYPRHNNCAASSCASLVNMPRLIVRMGQGGSIFFLLPHRIHIIEGIVRCTFYFRVYTSYLDGERRGGDWRIGSGSKQINNG